MNLPDASIYDGIEVLGLTTDVQGWHAEHPIFRKLIRKQKPTNIIEVGTWKGASALRMANDRHEMGGLMLPWKIYCVDTWLGSPEIWNNHNLAAKNPRRHGYPQVYFQFLHNVKAAGFERQIVPLPFPSRIGAGVLAKAGVMAELIYIDASHDFVDVLQDLKSYWPLLAPGGVMFGDDFTGFPGVSVAVETFSADRQIDVEVVDGNFWVMRKEKV